MSAYDYQCEDEACGAVQELIQSVHQPLPDALPCPRCGRDSFHVFLVAPGVLTGGMSHKTIDVAIGRDSEVRWNRINERQAVRDKIRKESGERALKRTGKDEYQPLKGAKLVAVETPPPTDK